jgi:hypothetical protein
VSPLSVRRRVTVGGRTLENTQRQTIDSVITQDETGKLDVASEARWLYWLGQAARRRRESCNVRRSAVAHLLEREVVGIERFERGITMPRPIEQVLAVYASLCGMPDAREIFQDALDLWYANGLRPELLSDITPQD